MIRPAWLQHRDARVRYAVVTTSQPPARSRRYVLAALAAGIVMAAGVVGVLALAPEPAVADAPISTVAPPTTGPVLAAPAAAITAAGAAGDRVSDLAAERETAATTRTPALTCEPHANARVVGNIIVNKDCPDLIAAKEASHRAWACQQGTITEGCGSVNGPKPSEAEQRKRIADGLVGVGGGYPPGTDEYETCSRNPVADVCGG